MAAFGVVSGIGPTLWQVGAQQAAPLPSRRERGESRHGYFVAAWIWLIGELAEPDLVGRIEDFYFLA
jgi:hypothetical protein